MLIEQQKDFKYLIVLLTGCTPRQRVIPVVFFLLGRLHFSGLVIQ